METVNKETSANKNESNVPHGFFHGYDLGATGNVITALLIAISVFLVCMVITVLFFWLNEEYDLEPSWGIGFFLGSDFICAALGVALTSTLFAGLLVYALKKRKDRTCDNHIFLGATLISIPLMLLTLVSVPVPNDQVQEYKNARICHMISTYNARFLYENGECVTQRNIQYVTQHIKVEEKSRNIIRHDSELWNVVGQEYTVVENKVFEGKEYKPGDTIFIPLEKITGGEYDTFHINHESNKNSDQEKNSGHDYKYLGSIEEYKYKGAYEITGLNHIEINGTTYDSVNEQDKTLYVDHETVTGKNRF